MHENVVRGLKGALCSFVKEIKTPNFDIPNINEETQTQEYIYVSITE